MVWVGGWAKGRHISDVNGQGYSDCCDGGGSGTVRWKIIQSG